MQIISSRRMSCTRDTSLDFSNPGPGFCPACGVVGDNPPDHCLWNFLPFSADVYVKTDLLVVSADSTAEPSGDSPGDSSGLSSAFLRALANVERRHEHY